VGFQEALDSGETVAAALQCPLACPQSVGAADASGITGNIDAHLVPIETLSGPLIDPRHRRAAGIHMGDQLGQILDSHVDKQVKFPSPSDGANSDLDAFGFGARSAAAVVGEP
jgi:hypothetical protein